MSNNETTFVVFFDSVGRTILGDRINADSNETTLFIKNPAVVHIVPNQQTGQLQLQILPLFFKEFLADKAEATIWKYNRANITESNDIVFDFKLQTQYQQIFSLNPEGQMPSQQPADTIKLFDEE
jgi:hypothetical protein